MNKVKKQVWWDYRWNPIVGCSPISPGCKNCYAAAVSERFHLPWGRAHFIPERLGHPAKVKKPSRVFVCSMSDIGHESVEPQWRTHIGAAMCAAPWHTYIVLTKRPGPWMRELPPSCWTGVSIETQDQMKRWELLCAWGYGLHFASVEPMLGRVSFYGELPRPDWVICGPETGPKARPCKSEWITDLRYECWQGGIPFYDKREGAFIKEFPSA